MRNTTYLSICWCTLSLTRCSSNLNMSPKYKFRLGGNTSCSFNKSHDSQLIQQESRFAAHSTRATC